MQRMESLLILLLSITVTVIFFMVAFLAGMAAINIFYRLRHRWLRTKLSIGGYQCFYLNAREVFSDTDSNRLAIIALKAYEPESDFSTYYSSLSLVRLPLAELCNWGRSIAEDVYCAELPHVKVQQWETYITSNSYSWRIKSSNNLGDYEEHERAFLWGAVYYWLTVVLRSGNNNLLTQSIVRIGCRKDFARPYFYYLYNAARHNIEAHSALPSQETTMPESEAIISGNELVEGFRQLSVQERRAARRLLNDLLADSVGWRSVLRQMKLMGWFHEPAGKNIVINHVDQLQMGDGNTQNHYDNNQ